jgi:hypothetical protein
MALRQKIDSKKINEYRASFHVDTGGPVGSDHFVTVKPQSDDKDWFITRWFYFDENNKHYAWNFAEKVCTDKDYRQKSREKIQTGLEQQTYTIHTQNDYIMSFQRTIGVDSQSWMRNQDKIRMFCTTAVSHFSRSLNL